MELLEVILAMHVTSILDIATLNTINFSHNAIGDRGITLLYQNFQWCHAKITSLSIWQCGFSVEGTKSIAKILESNMTLKTLEIHGNHIGNAGIITISNTLPKSSLHELHVNHCGFSIEGAKALAEALHKSNISSVNLWRNPITVEGARLLASLITVYRRIKFDDEYQEDPIVREFIQSTIENT